MTAMKIIFMMLVDTVWCMCCYTVCANYSSQLQESEYVVCGAHSWPEELFSCET